MSRVSAIRQLPGAYAFGRQAMKLLASPAKAAITVITNITTITWLQLPAII